MKEIEKIKKIIRFFIVFFLVVNILQISGCIDEAPHDNSRINYYVNIGMKDNISGFYPFTVTRDIPTLSVNVNLFDFLIKMDTTTFKFKPDLAKSWNNPNNLTWRFFLREGVTFHNGNIFTAEDVKFTVDYMKNYSFYRQELEPISDIVVVDNYTIDIITNSPCPNLLYKLINLFILSEDYILNIEGTNETWPIGTGAYKLLEYIPGDHITLERFNEYWDVPPEIEKVTFTKMNDPEELKNALIQREMDIVPLSIDDVAEIQHIDGLNVTSVQLPGVVYLGFDFRVNDSFGFKGLKNPVSDIRVRTAMYHAIDIETIIKQYLNNSADAASQFVTYHTFGYNPSIVRLSHDVERAKELMKEAEYEQGFSIECDCSNSPQTLNISNAIVTQLSEINITIILNPQPTLEYLTKLYYKNTSLYMTGLNIFDAEGLIKLLLHTPDSEENNGVWNYGNYSNPEVDRLCDILSTTMDTNLRSKYLQEAFSIAASDVAWIPLYSPKAFYGTTDDIEWSPNPTSFIFVEDISLKH